MIQLFHDSYKIIPFHFNDKKPIRCCNAAGIAIDNDCVVKFIKQVLTSLAFGFANIYAKNVFLA